MTNGGYVLQWLNGKKENFVPCVADLAREFRRTRPNGQNRDFGRSQSRDDVRTVKCEFHERAPGEKEGEGKMASKTGVLQEREKKGASKTGVLREKEKGASKTGVL